MVDASSQRDLREASVLLGSSCDLAPLVPSGGECLGELCTLRYSSFMLSQPRRVNTFMVVLQLSQESLLDSRLLLLQAQALHENAVLRLLRNPRTSR